MVFRLSTYILSYTVKISDLVFAVHLVFFSLSSCWYFILIFTYNWVVCLKLFGPIYVSFFSSTFLYSSLACLPPFTFSWVNKTLIFAPYRVSLALACLVHYTPGVQKHIKMQKGYCLKIFRHYRSALLPNVITFFYTRRQSMQSFTAAS